MMLELGYVTTRVALPDKSAVGEARRAAVRLSNSLGFDETNAGKVALITTELATNVVTHAREGEILLRSLGSGDALGCEIIAIDKGPGMRDVARCLEDGYSTAGTSGVGLGSLARNATRFEIYSQPDQGTVAVAELWKDPEHRQKGLLEIGAVCVAKATEHVCGDGWMVQEEPRGGRLLIVDGLGHGEGASEATLQALGTFKRHAFDPPAALMDTLHRALRSTRGAAASLVALRIDAASVTHVGVGNCAVSIVTADGSRSLAGHNGTLGAGQARIQEFGYELPPTWLLVLHTDGISSRFRLDAYPGLFARSPSLIAAVLYRDFGRERDDATVVVVRPAATRSRT